MLLSSLPLPPPRPLLPLPPLTPPRGPEVKKIRKTDSEEVQKAKWQEICTLHNTFTIIISETIIMKKN